MEFKAVIFDLDGCLYRGEIPIEGASESLEELRKMGFKIMFLTNNATKTVEEYTSRLNKIGIKCLEEEVLTSGLATSIYLAEKYGSVKVLPVGGKALEEELRRKGHNVLNWREKCEADFVVACLDFDFNYEKLKNACQAVYNGARFIATNADPTVPVENRLIPGAGAIVAAISKATGRKPLVVGKPSQIIMKVALKRLGVEGFETVVVGDRLDTDVKAGWRINALTVLVLTGATSLRDLERWRGVKPSLVLESVRELPKALRRL
ncbi:HAD-IIA family hydrolase [Candidatus Bathyarchaeota archaeon]|nr:HAD-IIA family hydrolase [Candidatus Bathyarchaeota archaeon]MBS7613389.1 HAD-IIA family hydrolase [Candidatus Bathyarchaeota archaeon]MBS7617119.1 HAD-IIA family hydrolase [Candidatus Bathyarchaeota archaeon]